MRPVHLLPEADGPSRRRPARQMKHLTSNMDHSIETRESLSRNERPYPRRGGTVPARQDLAPEVRTLAGSPPGVATVGDRSGRLRRRREYRTVVAWSHAAGW